ncbi:MAG: hypothetical protein F6K40_38265 [Okeania sp. SIO3I5]|nr:hypothetical protein [Okeania sp. SIO3I5]NEQ41719.1 hypothetical protein [Okeania sp. SIO3I5]
MSQMYIHFLLCVLLFLLGKDGGDNATHPYAIAKYNMMKLLYDLDKKG